MPVASAAVMIKLLLDFGADINATNEDGYNILHFVCNLRSSLDGDIPYMPLFNALGALPQGDILRDVVEALLIAGADIYFHHQPKDP